MAQYKCFEEDFNTLDTKIKCIIKKLDTHKLSYTYNVIGESIEEVAIYNANFQGMTKVGSMNVKVINYDFEMETIKLGNFEVVAILDHKTKNEQCDNNMVYISNSNYELPLYYYTANGNCDHCNYNRKRNTTAVLVNLDTNEFKQVGITCLKEYTGIDCIDVIHNFVDIHDIINDMDKMSIESSDMKRFKQYKKVTDYLANCIYCTLTNGYIKDKTKYEAFDIEEKVNEKYYSIANDVIEYFKSLDFLTCDNFNNNIRTALLQDAICYANGFIAYAYMSYEKEIAKQKELEIKKSESKGYYGNVGDKVKLDNVSIQYVGSYESYFGYYPTTTYIYKITTQDGFIFTWKTSKGTVETKGKEYMYQGEKTYEIINTSITEFTSIKGTIKAHTEYNGDLQTELTRCKCIVTN